jgi:hypothetical protein
MVWKTIPQAEDDGDIPGTMEVSGGGGFTWQADSRLLVDNTGGDPEFYVNVRFGWPVGTWAGNPPRFRITNSAYAASSLNEGWDYLASAWSGSDVTGDPTVYAEFPNLAPPGSGNPVTSDQINVWTPEQIELRPLVDDIDGVSFVYATGDNADFETQAVPFAEQSEWLVEVWVDEAPPAINYNCQCDDPNPSRTLAQLRTEMMVRLGFSAMTANPPPGMVPLLNSFLQGAQRSLYRQYTVLRTERFYTWNMEPGQRFYDLDANADECTKRLDPRMITWVGISDGDDWWRPLVCGIPPESYTWPNVQGWPQRYEIRQCIEVWPAPDDANLRLRIKGHFGLEPFEADGDQCTIDDEAVFLFALARAKAHYGAPDARNYQNDAQVYIKNLVSGSHMTRRYIPGGDTWLPPAPPLWIPKEGG